MSVILLLTELTNKIMCLFKILEERCICSATYVVLLTVVQVRYKYCTIFHMVAVEITLSSWYPISIAYRYSLSRKEIKTSEKCKYFVYQVCYLT